MVNLIFVVFSHQFLFQFIIACSADISGKPSNSAQFSISFFPPISYSFPPNGTEKSVGQAATETIAKQEISTDFNLAISEALKINQIYLSNPANISFQYDPPQVTISDADTCQINGTWISIDGTIMYQCVVDQEILSSTTDSSNPSTNQPQSTSQPSDSSTNQPQSTFSTEITTQQIPESSSIKMEEKILKRIQRSSSNIKSILFLQELTLKASTQVNLYSSQWNQIAKSVKLYLETKKVIFDKDILVTLL